MAGTLKSLMVKIGMDTAGLKSGVGQVNSLLGGMQTNSLGLGNAVGIATQKLTVATGEWNSFEDQLYTINTVAKLSRDDLMKVGDGLQALSVETGKTTDDLAGGYYDLLSAGVDAKDAMNVLRDSSILATGALGSVGDSVDLVTSVLNAYGMKATESGRVTDVFAKAVQDGKVTAAELGASIAQIAPIAATAGVSMEEVSSAFAIMTAKGEPAASTATKMKAAISALLVPNSALNKIQAETGVNFAELMKAQGVSVALDTLLKSVDGNTESFGKALGSVDAFQFALASTGDNAATFQQQIKDTGNAAGIAMSQYNEKSKSAVEQQKRFDAWLHTTIQDIGQFVSGAVPFLGSIGQIAPLAGMAIGGLKNLGGLARGIFDKLWPAVAEETAGATAAGLAHGKAYSLAAAAGAKLSGIGKGLWDKLSSGAESVGGMAGGKFGMLFKGAAMLGVAALFVEVGVQFMEFLKTIDSAQKEMENKAVAESKKTGAEAIKDMAGFAAKLNSVQGVDRIVGDTFGGKQMMDAFHNQLSAMLADTTLTGAQIADGVKAINLAIVEAQSRGNQETVAELQAGLAQLQAKTPAAEKTGAALGNAVGKGVTDAITNTTGAVNGAIKGVFTAAAGTVASSAGPTRRAMAYHGHMAVTLLSAGIKDGRDVVKNAMKDLMYAMEHPAQLAKFKARIEGALSGQKLAEGLRSKNPVIRNTAEAAKTALVQQWQLATGLAWDNGLSINDNLARGMWKTKPKVHDAARKTVNQDVKPVLESAIPAATTAGANTGQAFADGLASKAQAAMQASSAVTRAAGNVMKASSPPRHPMNGMRDVMKWGRATMEAYGDGMKMAHAHLQRSASESTQLTWNEPRFGWAQRRRASATDFGSPRGRAEGHGGGDTYHFHIGTLIANDQGIDELERRMENRKRVKGRVPTRYNDPS